jgi:hypothetical protein
MGSAAASLADMTGGKHMFSPCCEVARPASLPEETSTNDSPAGGDRAMSAYGNQTLLNPHITTNSYARSIM